jgi:hypothetical protein
MEFKIDFLNRFKKARDVKIHHFRYQNTTKHHIVKKNKSKELDLNSSAPVDKEYVIVELDHAPGELPGCEVTLGSSADFTFVPSGSINLRISRIDNKKIILRIPARSPEWKLKVAVPKRTDPGNLESQNVTIAEDEPGRPD